MGTDGAERLADCEAVAVAGLTAAVTLRWRRPSWKGPNHEHVTAAHDRQSGHRRTLALIVGGYLGGSSPLLRRWTVRVTEKFR